NARGVVADQVAHEDAVGDAEVQRPGALQRGAERTDAGPAGDRRGAGARVPGVRARQLVVGRVATLTHHGAVVGARVAHEARVAVPDLVEVRRHAGEGAQDGVAPGLARDGIPDRDDLERVRQQ